MDVNIPPFTAALVGSATFEEAAAIVGRTLLDTAAAAFESSRFGERHRVLRAMVHIRPDDGYRRLAVVEHDAGGAATLAPAAAPPHLPSATAWRWVAGHRCAVSLDVSLGRIQPHAPGVAALLPKSDVAAAPLASKETRDRLLDRRATHVCALPLRTPGGTISGMISVEVECRAALGKDVIWELAGEDLQALADIAAPHLVSLPDTPAPAAATDDLLPVVGASMAPLVAMLRVFAQQEETILLCGPTGAGKSRMARWCKERSARRDGPFEVLDLMTLPEELQMAELFGWKRGAFTGAVRDNAGCVARAENGTLFIDEIDKLSLKAQAGLLHLLEERTYRPLGEGTSERRANVRFVIGTNADLFARVQAGQFREDLYYRINVLPIKIPPLAERADEIAPWAEHMLQRRHRESPSDRTARLDPAAVRALTRSRWPGNLRQLDNVVRRAYALSLMARDGAHGELVLREADVLQALAYEQPGAAGSLTELLREAARRFVTEAEGRRLQLDDAEAFKGLVLATAAELRGNKEEALRLLGKEALLRNRNHHKPFRREMERAEALYRALGEEGQFPFRRWLEA